jgi:hypothetical protein
MSVHGSLAAAIRERRHDFPLCSAVRLHASNRSGHDENQINGDKKQDEFLFVAGKLT